MRDVYIFKHARANPWLELSVKVTFAIFSLFGTLYFHIFDFNELYPHVFIDTLRGLLFGNMQIFQPRREYDHGPTYDPTICTTSYITYYITGESE